MLVIGILLLGVFVLCLMYDVICLIIYMKNMVDCICCGYLDVWIEGKMYGELDMLKKGINVMVVLFFEYYVEM